MTDLASLTVALPEFLEARYGGELARAQAMTHDVNAESEYFSCPGSRTEPLGDLPYGEENCDCGLAVRKGRMLRDVSAKRAILARCREVLEKTYDMGMFRLAEFTVRQLGTEFEDHPGYRQEWKP